SGWRDLEAARARARELAAREAAAEERVALLRERIGRLRDDPLTLERLAREELGWVRPYDVLIVHPPEPPAPGGTATSPSGGPRAAVSPCVGAPPALPYRVARGAPHGRGPSPGEAAVQPFPPALQVAWHLWGTFGRRSPGTFG
ncbi:MAG: hypothetical protein KJ058_06000, partial [Thermoanaerobaculia bacterium]|nr:hypothetical protein [Thermoanaerobaculia bacterium]